MVETSLMLYQPLTERDNLYDIPGDLMDLLIDDVKIEDIGKCFSVESSAGISFLIYYLMTWLM